MGGRAEGYNGPNVAFPIEITQLLQLLWQIFVIVITRKAQNFRSKGGNLNVLDQRQLLRAANFLFFVAATASTVHGACTFTNLIASRDSSGAKVSASPTQDQCDSSSTLPLDLYNLYNTNAPNRIFTFVQVTYVSGPRAISVNGSSKSAGTVIGKAFIHDTVSLRFDVEGDYNFTVSPGGGGPSASSQTFQVKISHFTMTPAQLDVATGGVASNVLNVSTGLAGQLRIGSTLIRNGGGESSATLSINTQGRATASSYRQSGIFAVSASILTFNRYAQITVPPQPLIQVLIGEAQAQGDNAKSAVAGIIKNRLNKSWFGNLRTYNDLIFARNQFTSVVTPRFVNAQSRSTASSQPAYDSAVGDASKVFDGRLNVPFANAIGYGSPGATNNISLAQAELSKLQGELNRCHKVSATTLWSSGSYWYHGLVEFPSIPDQQLVIFSEVPMSEFVFIRPRPQNGCAVVQQSWSVAN